MKTHRPEYVPALAYISTILSKLKLDKKINPEELEDESMTIENEYRCTIDRSIQAKIFVVKAESAQYTDVIWSESLCKGAHTTVENLIEAMSKY